MQQTLGKDLVGSGTEDLGRSHQESVPGLLGGDSLDGAKNYIYSLLLYSLLLSASKKHFEGQV